MQTQRDGGFFWTIAEHQHTQTQPHGSLPSPLAGHQQATYTQTQPDGGLSSPVSEHQQATQPDSGSSAAAKQRKPKNASQVPAIGILAMFRLLITLLYRI